MGTKAHEPQLSSASGNLQGDATTDMAGLTAVGASQGGEAAAAEEAAAEELVGSNQVVAQAPDGTVFYLYKHQVSPLARMSTRKMSTDWVIRMIIRQAATSRS